MATVSGSELRAKDGDEARSVDFIRARVAEDLASEKRSTVVTRFPPEPNV